MNCPSFKATIPHRSIRFGPFLSNSRKRRRHRIRQWRRDQLLQIDDATLISVNKKFDELTGLTFVAKESFVKSRGEIRVSFELCQ